MSSPHGRRCEFANPALYDGLTDARVRIPQQGRAQVLGQLGAVAAQGSNHRGADERLAVPQGRDQCMAEVCAVKRRQERRRLATAIRIAALQLLGEFLQDPPHPGGDA